MSRHFLLCVIVTLAVICSASEAFARRHRHLIRWHHNTHQGLRNTSPYKNPYSSSYRTYRSKHNRFVLPKFTPASPDVDIPKNTTKLPAASKSQGVESPNENRERHSAKPLMRKLITDDHAPLGVPPRIVGSKRLLKTSQPSQASKSSK